MNSSQSAWSLSFADRRPWVPTVLVFLACGVFSLLFVNNVERLRIERAEQQARQLASAVAHDFGERLDRSLSATYAIATLVRQGGGKVANFETIAAEMLVVYGGITALQLAPGGTIRHVVPLAGNEAVVGFSPMDDPNQGREARRVVASRRLGLTGPFELRQGGMGVVGRFPIFLRDDDGADYFWGMTQVVIRIPDLLAATRIEALTEAGYAYELWRNRPDDDRRQVFARNRSESLVSPIDERFEVPNGEWVLSVAPVAGWYPTTQILFEWSAALVFSWLVAFATYLLLRQPSLLRREVERRTVELKDSETKYRQFFNGNPVPLLVYDFRSLAFLDVNDAFLESYGYSRNELANMTLRDLHPEDDRFRLGAYMDEVSPDGYRHAGGWRHVRRNGEVIDVEVTSHGILYDGQPARMALAIDVSQRKRSEEAMRQHNLWLSSIFEHFPGGVSVTDARQRVVAWNQQFLALLEFPAEMFEGEPRALIDYIRYNAERGEYGDVDVDAYVTQAAARINQHEPHHFERVRPNGLVLDVRGTPLPDGGFVSSYIDITERKAAEQALLAANRRYEQLNAELEARVADRTRMLAAEVEERRLAENAVRQSARWLREIIDTLATGIVLWDRNQCLMAWNSAFERMFPEAARHLQAGIGREALMPLFMEDGALPLHDENSASWDHLGRWERPLPDGRIIAVERLATSEGGRLMLHTDVTAQVKTGEVLARNERMASLGNLVAGIAHEINTPIGNALMVASAVGERIGEFESSMATGALRRSVLESFLSSMRESDDLIERNLRRAADLIQNFKQVAVDQTSDQRRDFDLATVLEEVRMTLGPRLRQASCTLSLDAEVGVAMDSFPGAIGQIVTNLVENALLHAFEGRNDGHLDLVARQVDASVEIVFSDNGSGIPPEVLPRIFDPFFTTRLGKGGSGLGLSIVLNLVRDLLGGELHVESLPGHGTEFRLALPTKAPSGKPRVEK